MVLRAELDALQASLDRDYRLVNHLLRQAGNLPVGGSSLEQIMLRIDFFVMRVWYALARRVSESASKTALKEMTQIVGHFANEFGEQAKASVRV